MSGARLWRYHAGLGLLGVRAWPREGPTRVALEKIHDWLREAGDLGFVPVPIRGLDGRTVYESAGRCWEVAPWMKGIAESAVPPSGRRVAAGFASLAAFHQRLARHRTQGTSPGLLARLREINGLLGGGFSVFERAFDAHPAGPVCGPARRWLDEAKGKAIRVQKALERGAAVVIGLQPCLRDVRPDHLLFTDDRVTGLVDFGAMGHDTITADLGRLDSEWLGRDPALRSIGLDAYHAARPIAPAELALIDVFEESAALLGPAHWVRWHFLEGRTFEDPTAVARGIEKGLDRLRERTGV